jgi:hypothetical protein
MMDIEEFRKKLEEFFSWVSHPKVKESSYWLALEEFAARKFNECYEAENGKKKA